MNILLKVLSILFFMISASLAYSERYISPEELMKRLKTVEDFQIEKIADEKGVPVIYTFSPVKSKIYGSVFYDSAKRRIFFRPNRINLLTNLPEEEKVKVQGRILNSFSPSLTAGLTKPLLRIFRIKATWDHGLLIRLKSYKLIIISLLFVLFAFRKEFFLLLSSFFTRPIVD